MKRIFVLGILFLLSSCQNKQVLLPEANETVVADIKDYSQTDYLFKIMEKDTLIEINKSNSTNAANRLFNIDKRFPLRKVILEIKKLQTNKPSENYFA